jgi:hypothetical protein
VSDDGFSRERARLDRPKPTSYLAPTKPAEQVGTIHGQTPGSMEEWRTAKALWRAGWAFAYQVPVAGGRSRRGGQVVDFLVYTPVRPTPIYVQGSYWHGGAAESEDRIKQALLQRQVGGRWADPIILWDYELKDDDMAYQTILRVLGRGGPANAEAA